MGVRYCYILGAAAGLGVLAAYASVLILIAVIVALILGIALILPRHHSDSVGFWWMNPAWAIIIGILPGILLCISVSSNYFVEQWGSPKFITAYDIWLCIALVAAFIVGARLSSSFSQPQRPVTLLNSVFTPSQITRLERLTRGLFWLTILGYVLWVVIGVARGLRPSDISAIFSGGSSFVTRSFLAPVSGVTTLTQFGPVAAGSLMILRRTGTRLHTRRYLTALLLLALGRALVHTERLALVEIVMPMMIIALAFPMKPLRWRRMLTLLPLWLPLVVLVFFGSFEYSRSYSSAYYRSKNSGHSYGHYAVTRLGAYYAAALNNGVLLIRTDHRSRPIPYYTLEWLWKFPGIQSALSYERLAGISVVEEFKSALDAEANPNFNNPSGILAPVFDLGRIGALAFWFITGGVMGYLFVLFRNGDTLGLLMYPVVFIGLLEVGLVLYWPSGRAFPSIVGALFVGLRLRAMRSDPREMSSHTTISDTKHPSLEPQYIPEPSQ